MKVMITFECLHAKGKPDSDLCWMEATNGEYGVVCNECVKKYAPGIIPTNPVAAYKADLPDTSARWESALLKNRN